MKEIIDKLQFLILNNNNCFAGWGRKSIEDDPRKRRPAEATNAEVWQEHRSHGS